MVSDSVVGRRCHTIPEATSRPERGGDHAAASAGDRGVSAPADGSFRPRRTGSDAPTSAPVGPTASATGDGVRHDVRRTGRVLSDGVTCSVSSSHRPSIYPISCSVLGSVTRTDVSTGVDATRRGRGTVPLAGCSSVLRRPARSERLPFERPSTTMAATYPSRTCVKEPTTAPPVTAPARTVTESQFPVETRDAGSASTDGDRPVATAGQGEGGG